MDLRGPSLWLGETRMPGQRHHELGRLGDRIRGERAHTAHDQAPCGVGRVAHRARPDPARHMTATVLLRRAQAGRAPAISSASASGTTRPTVNGPKIP